MLAKILNLQGVEKIEKKMQSRITGGRLKCKFNGSCVNYGSDCNEHDCQSWGDED